MSFARRVLLIALLIQIVGFIREITFVVGLDHLVAGLSAGNPTLVGAVVVLLGSVALIAPVLSGNRWATLAATVLLGFLIVIAVPPFAALFGSPTVDNFLVWLTLTVMIVSAAVGLPFGILATLEAFGRRRPGSAIVGETFSPAAVFAAAGVGSIVGMTIVAVAVAASPGGNAAFDEAPDEYATVVMRELRFEPANVSVASDRTTAVFVVNEDAFDHSFDIDELNIHLIVPGGQTRLVIISPPGPGSSRVYCAIPGHTEAGMEGQLVAR